MPISGPAVPLAGWADARLAQLASETGSAQIAALAGEVLLAERGSNSNFSINYRASAGLGRSRLNRTRDGDWFALTLLRDEDRELLPALFLGEVAADDDDAVIAEAIARFDCAGLLERGRLLGLPVASAGEVPVSPPLEILARGRRRLRPPGHRPLVVDLSSIWAGPLAGHLLWLAGAEVVKIESLGRTDLIRRDDPLTFALINQGKASVVLDFHSSEQKAALIALIRRADFVIESTRVRALRHLGIDADALVREVPGLVWLSITGHGATGEAAAWAGIGNDCSVTAGFSRALADATGEIGYVGDAITDPLTGITAALEGWRAYASGDARRIAFAMSAIGAEALAQERARDPAGLHADLVGWGAAAGQPFPKVAEREMLGELRPLGADTNAWFPPC